MNMPSSSVVAELSPIEAAVTVVALGFVAAVLGAVAALLHRLYSREPAPVFLNVLVGLGGIAIWLNTSGALGHFVAGDGSITELNTAAVNLVSLAVGGVAAAYGGKFGDLAAVETTTVAEISYEGELKKLVRAAGRTVTVKIPDDVHNIDGYDPVTEETKTKVAGAELTFPRGLTVGELRDRVAERLKQDYEVGYVDIELDDKGNVEFLGLGSRIAGIGPTLPPGSCALAVRADPAYASSPGDAVQLWRQDETGAERVAVGELRAAAGDTVTVSLDENDAGSIDQSATYRLVTLPSEKGPEKEFAAMLRSVDETMSVVSVKEGDTLAGATVGSVSVTVVAVHPTDGELLVVPPKSHTIGAGDDVYAVGRPEELRRLTSTGK